MTAPLRLPALSPSWLPVSAKAVRDRMQELKEGEDVVAMKCLKALLTQSMRHRPTVTATQIRDARALARRFPNFAEYIQWIVNGLQLSCACQMPVKLPPHLLVGPPGLGKSFILSHIAQALGLSHQRISVPEITANFVLTGSTSTWHGSQPGLVARSLEAGPVPWLVFDEIDKCPRHGRFDVEPTFLSMLESSTAAEFRDECLQLELDIRPLVFTFTANRADSIEPALLSRLAVFHIDKPKDEDMPAVVASVDHVLRGEDPRIAMLYEPLSDPSRELFTQMAPRAIKQVLTDAYLAALRVRPAGRIELPIKVIQRCLKQHLATQPTQRSIGFHA